MEITGIGLTVIVNEMGVPGQLLAVGVTVIVPEMFEVVLLVVTNEGIVAPVPDAAKPIAVLVFVQL